MRKEKTSVPVVPHKAAAEVSKIGNYRRGDLLWWMDGRASPLMDHKVVGVSGDLSFNMSIYLSFFLSFFFLSFCLSFFQCLPACLPVCLSVCLSIYLSTCLSTGLSIYLSIYLSICLCNLKQKLFCVTGLQSGDVSWKTKLFCETSFKFRSWRHQKRSNSARCP